MRAMRARVLGILMLFSTVAAARPPRPQLAPDAAALLARGPAVLLASEDLLVPLDGKKAVRFLDPPPAQLAQAAGDSLVIVDGDLFRVRAGALERVASAPGAEPACSADCALVAGVEDKRALKLTTKEGAQLLPYRRDGRWELHDPWVTPDGARVLATVRDYTQPLDAWDFLIVDVKSRSVEELHLSKNFVPGATRRPLDDGRVAIQMYTQREDEPGLVTLSETSVAVFDFKTHKLGAPTPSLRSLRVSPSGRWVLSAGEAAFRADRACGGERTLVADGDRRAEPLADGDTLVSALDLLPDDGGLVASVLSLKSCHARLMAIPFGAEEKKWRALAAPAHTGAFAARLLRALK
jgi:hypothetical protein